jgi:intracellular sulfur oxidation DsrE/DsrF family protein
MAACRRTVRSLVVTDKTSFFNRRRSMSKLGHIAKAAAAGAMALVVATSLSAAQDSRRAPVPLVKQAATTAKTTKPAAPEQAQARSAFARATQPATEKSKEHSLILQVNTNDPAAMNLALNNATNVAQYYRDLGDKVKIELITFGPGLHMLREDTSPVKARIETMSLSMPEISFKACGNTRENMHKAEDKEIPIIQQAQVVKSGVVRVMELQEHGWTYVKP